MANQVLFCHQCGNGLAPGSRFCPGCGTAVDPTGGIPSETVPIDSVEAEWTDVLRQLRQATLGQYDIGALLGAGGMAAVFLAHQIALDRKVAIKVLRPSLLAAGASEESQVVVSRFRQEARTIASFRHPNIVDIYEVREAGRLNFFIMEFIQGRSLDRVLRDEGMLAVPVARAIIGQVANALAYAHRRGVVHRDIKPANIMLDHEGNAIVTDFGIAKVAEGQQLTRTNYIVGTPAYLSPEQCRAGTLSGATDQYALGVVAYELLAGVPPFREQIPAILYAHLEQEPPPLRPLRPDCPPELEASVFRMLAKQPDQRYPTLTEAAEAITGGERVDLPAITAELVRLSTGAAGSEPALPTTPLSPTPSLRPERSPLAPASQPAPPPVSRIESLAPPVQQSAATPASIVGSGSSVRVRVVLGLVGLIAVVGFLMWGPFRPISGVDEARKSPGEPGGQSPEVIALDSSRATDSVRAPAETTAIRGTVAPASLRLRVGQEGSASVRFENAKDSLSASELEWRSSNPATATVERGTVSAKAIGSARISAWLAGRELGGTQVTVVSNPPATAARPAAESTAKPGPGKSPPARTEVTGGLRVATQCLSALETRDTLLLASVFRNANRKDRTSLTRIKSLFRNREWQTRVQVLSAPAPQAGPDGVKAYSFTVSLNFKDSFGDNQTRKAVFTVEAGADGVPACFVTDKL